MNQQGEGGPVDWIEAARLYRAACDGNNAAGCANLGFIYLNGNGVAKDDVMARTLHEKGCTLGSSSGCNSFAYAMMIGRGGPRDEAQARPIFEKECGRNNGNSCDNLGVLLRDGRGGAADQVKARALFDKGCDLNVSAACNSFSDSLLSSAGGPTDRARAILMRQISCFSMDNADACRWLTEGGHRDPAMEGTILANKKKFDRALPLLTEACNANSAKGCLALAALAPPGAITESRRNDLFRKACSLGDQDACQVVADRQL